MVDPIFCTVADSCRIVAGQLPDSCRLCFTQLPSFWLEKGLILQNLLFSDQNDGNCVKNKRQLSGNWPATIRQLPATVQKIRSAKRGGPRIARLATLLRPARSDRLCVAHPCSPWPSPARAELAQTDGVRNCGSQIGPQVPLLPHVFYSRSRRAAGRSGGARADCARGCGRGLQVGSQAWVAGAHRVAGRESGLWAK